jgi:hypothetical protein
MFAFRVKGKGRERKGKEGKGKEETGGEGVEILPSGKSSTNQSPS